MDDVAYEDQVEEKLRKGERLRKIEGEDYARVSASSFGLGKGPRIGVIQRLVEMPAVKLHPAATKRLIETLLRSCDVAVQ